MTKVIDVEKVTNNDTRRMLDNAIGDDGWVVDFDEEFVYIDSWDNIGEKYTLFKLTYSISDDNVVTLSTDKIIVVALTDYQTVGDSVVTEKSISGYISKALDKYFGGSKRKDISVIKQFGDESEMFCVEPLYCAPLVSDGDGDMMSSETITNMVESLNKANSEGRLQNGLFHKHNTDVWSLDKAWVNPTDCFIGDTLVPEGQPIAKTIFTNVEAFELRKIGDIAGLSIGARATEIVDLNKSAEELKILKSSPEAVREIIGTHFNWEHPELTYTSLAQGGAAHMQNTALDITKAKKATKEDLLPQEVTILKKINEEFVSLEKHLGADNNQTPSSSAEAKVGEETKGNLNKMSEKTVTREEFEELQKALNVSRAENALMGYGFDTELNKSLADTLADMKSPDVITQAFDALIARGEEAVVKAKASTPEGETELQKTLAGEAGETGEPEAEVEKSFLDNIRAHQDKGAK